MGFYFGSSPETLKRACLDIGAQWDPKGWYPAQEHACSGIIPALAVSADVSFDFQADRMISIDARWEPSPKEVVGELNRIADILWDTYGTPGAIQNEVPGDCTDLIACVEGKKANLGFDWQFKGAYSVGVAISAFNHKPAVHLIYFTPDKINKFKINGL
jgi:hypothetical protein